MEGKEQDCVTGQVSLVEVEAVGRSIRLKPCEQIETNWASR